MKQAETICPHCGGDVDDGSVLRAGPFTYSEAGGFRIAGKPLEAQGAGQMLVGEIMNGRGVVLEEPVLREAIGTTAAGSSNVINVQLYNVRKAMKALGFEWPIAGKHGIGWYWIGPTVAGNLKRV